jgi:hypothetical protein
MRLIEEVIVGDIIPIPPPPLPPAATPIPMPTPPPEDPDVSNTPLGENGGGGELLP